MKNTSCFLVVIVLAVAGCATRKVQNAMGVPPELFPPGWKAQSAQRMEADAPVATVVAPPAPALLFLNDDRYVRTSGETGWASSIRLITYQPDECEFEENCVLSTNWTRKIVFSMALVNTNSFVWPGPSAADHPEYFSTNNCHGHVHMEYVSDFGFFNLNGVQVGHGQKEGWCIRNLVRFTGTNNPVAGACDAPVLAPGWGDIYGPMTPCTGVDVTGLPDGYYLLRVAIDPLNRYGFQQTNSQLVYLSKSSVENVTTPALSITQTTNSVTVRWSAPADWNLQTSDDLATWKTTETFAGSNRADFPKIKPRQFFRLALLQR